MAELDEPEPAEEAPHWADDPDVETSGDDGPDERENEPELAPVGTYSSWFEAQAVVSMLVESGFDASVAEQPANPEAVLVESVEDGEQAVEVVVPVEQVGDAIELLAEHSADPFADHAGFETTASEHDELSDDLMTRRARNRRVFLAPALLLLFLLVLLAIYLIVRATLAA